MDYKFHGKLHGTSEGRIVVIGGGLAGCSAALALARARLPVTLVEAKSRLGGRVGSYTDQATGHSIDYCQHVGMGCCTNLRQLINWLGQSAQWELQNRLFFFGPDEQRQTLRALPYLPAPAHLVGWLWRWPGLSLSERARIGRALLTMNRIELSGSEAEKLDDCAALTWLRAQRQSPQALQRFWSTIVVSALGEELDRVGILALAKVFQDGFLRHRDAFHLLIPRRPLDDLFGRQVHTALTTAGVDVLLSTPVVNMVWQGSTCSAIGLASGSQITASAAVVAVPWHGVERLVNACPDAAIRDVGTAATHLQSSPISGVHTWWDQAWLPTQQAVLVGRLCQWIFPQAQRTQGISTVLEVQQPPDAPEPAAPSATEHYYQIVISASRSLPRGNNEAVKQLIEADLRAVFPEARSAKLLRVRVVTDPHAVFSVAPGTHRLRVESGSHSGNLYWAGDWVRTGWPATMEGAVLSGFRAAESIAAQHGLQVRFVADAL